MILAIETSSLVCGVSLHEAGECIAEIHFKEPRVHAEKLVGLVGQIFEEQTIRVQKLAAVVVSVGPGSFTGLRIGMSFAKGLVYPHQIPLAGVNTMKAFMAAAIRKINMTERPICVIRSHKDYIYAAEIQKNINSIHIRYGQIKDIMNWYPACRHIVSNEALNEIRDVSITEKAIMPSAIGNYYITYMNNSAGIDYDSLVLEYGMEYKPKIWNPETPA